MERDLHFLERSVQRLDRADTEFVLRLYQDPAALQGLLRELRLPEGDQRIALGLGVDGGGPWLVLTRQGQFVTCLGEEMAPTGCFAVPAQQVASVLARVKRQLAELDAANARVPEDRQTAFLNRLLKIGPWLSREDFRCYAAWQPALLRHYCEILGAQLEVLLTLRKALPRARQRPPRAIERVLRMHWEAFYSLQTMVPLLALDGRVRDLAPLLCGRQGLFLATTGELLPLLRTAWAAGRFGKPVVAELKQVVRDDPHPDRRFAALLALLTVALRHRSLKAEIAKVLVAGTGSAAGDAGDVLAPATRRKVVEEMLDDPAVYRKSFLDIGRRFVVQVAGQRRGVAQARWPSEALVADEVAGPLLSLSSGTFRTNQSMLVAAVSAPAWLADLEAPDLFLPADACHLLREPWSHEEALGLAERLHPDLAAPEPVRVTKVGRNDPCICGSGSKAKRCCGERVEAPTGQRAAVPRVMVGAEL